MGETTITCHSCQAVLDATARFCSQCGARVSGQGAPTPDADLDESEYQARLQRALGEGFRIGERLGQGGFGTVYSVWDEKLEREVAVKALRHDLFGSAQMLRRFEREAKAVAKLNHPHILPIHFLGEGEGITYMVMPMVVGETLREFMDKAGRLEPEEAARITAEVASALEAAHEQGIVHRDIKPDNIMLEGPNRHALVMDFGIAKAAGGGDSTLTGSGMILGTPLYMSPEQAGGESEIDPRSDIYSLGVVAFEMLSGRPPFQGESPREVLAKHITAEPPDLLEELPGTPRVVIHAIWKCLRKEPGERWDSAGDLDEALRSLADPLVSRAQSRVLLRVLMAATLAAASLLFVTGEPLTVADAALFLPVLVALVGQHRAGREPEWARFGKQPFQLAPSFEGGLYGGLVGGGLGGLSIAFVYLLEPPLDLNAEKVWRMSHVFLVGSLCGVVLGATITLAVFWLRHVGDRYLALGEATGGVLGGVLGGIPLGVLDAWIFVPRPYPLIQSVLLFPMLALVGLGIIMGILLYDYRGGRLRDMMPPMLGALAITAFAVALTVRLFPYETVTSRYWIGPNETLGTWKIAKGGIILGAVGGTMLGIQAGATLALNRIWKTLRRRR